ncbi:MAG: S8 family serine peptidase [Candidatus Parabeggiatoa sp.]|nr:S8 family serine peptidase [Candidatus Parabeggiatoa sp.]
MLTLSAAYAAEAFDASSREAWVAVPWRFIPTGDVVLNRTTVQLRMSNQRFGLIKGMSIDGNETYEIAVNERGKQVNLDAILHEDKKAYLEKYGKISPTLYNKMAMNPSDEALPVVLWLAVEEEKVDKSQFDAQQLDRAPQSLLNYRQRNQEARSKLRTQLGNKLQVEVQAESNVAPVLYLELTASQIQKLNRWDEVGGIFLHETEGFDDLANSMAISNADDVVNTLGFDGTGSRVCVWEPGPDVLTNLVISGHYSTPWPGSSSHARLVTGIIRNSGTTPNGYAPGATVYSANSYDVAALDWCVNSPQTSRIINQSFHRRDEALNGELSADDLHKDYMALHSPYPTIVQASGNYWLGDSDNITPPADEFVNHKGFNSISVGNHNDTATAMSSSSVFRNPNSPHGDRELPELCANGDSVTAVGTTMSGTSFASPAVAGAVALLQEENTTLRYWPEGNRAILLAGATQNVSGNTWRQDVSAGVDASDGSGALNAEESTQIAQNRVYENNSASMRGWAVGTLMDSSFGSDNNSTYSYNVLVPSTGGNHVKVALAWDSKVTNSPATSELVIDMDLLVYDGSTIVASSASLDNSYEIAEFNGVAGRTYTVKLRRWSGAGESTYYGLAWSVH